jgi:hypothetical protein
LKTLGSKATICTILDLLEIERIFAFKAQYCTTDELQNYLRSNYTHRRIPTEDRGIPWYVIAVTVEVA